MAPFVVAWPVAAPFVGALAASPALAEPAAWLAAPAYIEATAWAVVTA